MNFSPCSLTQQKKRCEGPDAAKVGHRAWIKERYGYIRERPDLRKYPHN